MQPTNYFKKTTTIIIIFIHLCVHVRGARRDRRLTCARARAALRLLQDGIVAALELGMRERTMTRREGVSYHTVKPLLVG